MKTFVLLKLMPLFWQANAQDENYLIQAGQKTVMGLGSEEEVETNVNFYDASVTVNTIHLTNGNITYGNIGFVQGRAVDLVVTVVPGTTYTSDQAPGANGLSGYFGKINLRTVQGDPKSGEGNFRFCFHDHETKDRTVVHSFRWAAFDIDMRKEGDKGQHERLKIDLSQVEEYFLHEPTELEVYCEDRSSTTCTNHRTVFHSTKKGAGHDNPSNPNNLTELQMSRSVVFSFKEKECFDVTFDHYCKAEEIDPSQTCTKYTGGNFLFSGDAYQIVAEGHNFVSAPPAGAYGDPHCVNAKGDWFDIHAVGRIPMVILPLGTRIENSDFAVIATTTTPDGWDKCAPTFISAVDVWANQAHDQLRVDAGPAGDLQVKRVNGSTEAYSIKMLSEKVMITFRSVIVSVILNKVPKIDQSPFLYFDMEVAGLQALKAGGILGSDPHDSAQVQPDGCSEVPFKHRAVDRYSMARAMP